MVSVEYMNGASGRTSSRLHEDIYLRYLEWWARLVVRRRKPFVIGVTGSVGKTTTRQVIAAVLSASGAYPSAGLTWATPRNMNNRFGVPLTLLGYRGWTPPRNSELVRALTVPFRAMWMATRGQYPRTFVVEFSAVRDTAARVSLAPPNIGIVTAVGPAHLDYFGTVEKLVEAKSAVVQAVPATGLVVLGADNNLASGMDRWARAPVVKVPGKGRALSDAIARVVAQHLGVPDDVIERALAEQPPVKSRQEEIDLGTVTVMDDAFNANPLSMEHGLEVLAERAGPGQRRVAVLGEMAEMGTEKVRYHREMAKTAQDCADVVVGVGPLARFYEPDHWFETSDECARAIPDLISDGDYVLVKGSHSSRLSVVIRALRDAFKPVPANP